MTMKSKHLLIQASLFHVLNDGYKVAIVTLIPLVAKMLSLSYAQAGLLGTVLAGVGTVTAIPASVVAAKLGDLRVIRAGMLLYTLPLLLIGWTTRYPLLILLFGIGGIGFGLFHSVGSAWVAKVSPCERMGQNLGLFTAAGDIGKVVLPVLTTLLLTRTSLTLTSSILGSFGILAMISSLFISTHAQVHLNSAPDSEQPRSDLSSASTLPGARLALAIILGSLDCFVQEPMMLFIPFLMLARGISAKSVGLALSVYCAGSFVGKSLLGHIADKKGNATTIIFAKLGMAGFAVFLASSATSVDVLLLVLFALGYLSEGTAPVIKSMVGESMPVGSYNLVFGASGTLNALLAGLSSYFFGLVADRFHIESVFYTNAAFAALMVVPALVYRGHRASQAKE